MYEEALAVEMSLRRINFLRQPKVEISYKGVMVGEGRLDFLVGGQLVVELKVVDTIHTVHHAQVLGYLRVVNMPWGLLLNFKSPLMKDGIERIVHTR